jgi:hypothetical protein
MDNPKNRLKQALLKKQRQIGLWSTLSSNYTVEVLAGAGFDWLVLDTEHSPADLENLLGQLQAVAPYPTTPVVRVPWNDMVNIKRVLDLDLLGDGECTADGARVDQDAIIHEKCGRPLTYPFASKRSKHSNLQVFLQLYRFTIARILV